MRAHNMSKENEMLKFKEQVMLEYSSPECSERVKLANKKLFDCEKEISLLKEKIKFKDAGLLESKKQIKEVCNEKIQMKVRLEEMAEVIAKLRNEIGDNENQENFNFFNQIRNGGEDRKGNIFKN